MQNIDLAPIVLFVYNRPLHTRQTLEALSKNIYADQSELIVFADGPKQNATTDDLIKIEEVRKLVKEKKWCKHVELRESSENKGLAKSIIEGVTEIVNRYGKIIVLEDDLVTSPFFLKYMNLSLNIYQEDSQVGSVNAFMYPVDNLPEFFFMYGGDCWGWGTWDRAWCLLEKDGEQLLQKIKDSKRIKEFDEFGIMLNTLESQIRNKSKVWHILWYASLFLNNKLGIFTSKSFVNNIGQDSSGVHGVVENHSKFINLNNDFDEENLYIKNKTENRIAKTQISKYIIREQKSVQSHLLLRVVKKIRRMFSPKYLVKNILNSYLDKKIDERISKKLSLRLPIEAKSKDNYLVYGNGEFILGKGGVLEDFVTLYADGLKLEIGENYFLDSFAYLRLWEGWISIGSNFYLGPFSVLYGHGGLKIGNNVLIASHVTIIPANHNYSNKNVIVSEQGETTKGIEIGDDVWIGTGAKILDGVILGKGCIVGAGSVVTKSFADYSVIAGIPAKLIKTR